MIRQRFIRIAAPLATGLVLASCSDLAAVREFASIPAQPEVYNGLVDEYVQSSDRQKQYVEVDRFPDVDKVTEARRKQTTGLLALHSTLASYMKMLGKLADDKVPQPGDSTEGIKAGLAGMSGDLKLNKTQVTAFGKLLDVVTRASIDGYRRAQLVEVLRNHDNNVQQLVKQMQFVANESVRESLATEEAALSKRYQGILLTIGDPNNPVYAQSSHTWYDDRKELIRKQDACGQYAKSLAKISEGHSKLAREAGSLSNKAITEMISSYRDDAKSLYDSARALLE